MNRRAPVMLSNLPTRLTLPLLLPPVQHFGTYTGKCIIIALWFGFVMGDLKRKFCKNSLPTHKLKISVDLIAQSLN